MDQNLRNPPCLILSHTQIPKLGVLMFESKSKPFSWNGRNPRTMLQELRRRISAASYGWDCPLPFIYPGFDCGSHDVSKQSIGIPRGSTQNHLGVAQNSTAGVTQLFVLVSMYQGAMLGTLFLSHSHVKNLQGGAGTCLSARAWIFLCPRTLLLHIRARRAHATKPFGQSGWPGPPLSMSEAK